MIASLAVAAFTGCAVSPQDDATAAPAASPLSAGQHESTPVCPPQGVVVRFGTDRTTLFDVTLRSYGELPGAPGICQFHTSDGKFQEIAGGVFPLIGGFDNRRAWEKMLALFPLAEGRRAEATESRPVPRGQGRPGARVSGTLTAKVDGSDTYVLDGVTRPVWRVDARWRIRVGERMVNATHYDVLVDKKTGMALSMRYKDGLNAPAVSLEAKQLLVPGEATTELYRAALDQKRSCNTMKWTQRDKDLPVPDIYPVNLQLDYPGMAQAAGLSGRVLVDVEIDASGQPVCVNPAALQQGTSTLLAQAAVLSLRKATFKPYRVDGVPTAGRFVLPVRYSLQGEGSRVE